MPKSYSSQELIRFLMKEGFVLRSVRDSHHKYVKDNRRVIVPHPKKDIRPGTLFSILKQAGFELSDLEK